VKRPAVIFLMVVLLIGVVVASPTRRSTVRQIDITRQTFPVTDRAYSDEGLARLYDVLNPWGPSDDFYLDLVMSAGAVLDVGCGTGALLRRARDCGHTGRLCGLDPATAMLDQARRRPDIEWVLGDIASAGWDQEFDLVVMTGHAFQVLLDDDVLRRSLVAIRSALVDGGRFVFETRNPADRAWERWTPDNAVEVTDVAGAVVRVGHRVDSPVLGDVVRFTTTFTSQAWIEPRVSRSSLRFLTVDSLCSFLSDSELVVEEQFGDWAHGPLRESSPEIITLARRS
jgi:SAM-dependent methyltransferase